MSISSIFKTLLSGFGQFGVNDAADILIIMVLMYKLIVWTKETRAYGVIKGVGLLLLCMVGAEWLQLNTLAWVLNSILTSGSIFIIIFILFQNEIRRVLEKLGRSGKKLGQTLSDSNPSSMQYIIRDLTQTLLRLSHRRVGALLVFEQDSGLGDIVDTGVRIDGRLSGALIENIFEPNTPLHDGAVILKKDIIIAASCLLPLSDNYEVSRELGTRHRAALGMSTATDAIVLVVSEETGAISVARDGKLIRYLDEKALRDTLTGILEPKNTGFRIGRKKTSGGKK